MLRSTRRKHNDYRNLSLALDEIVNAALFINEQKRVYEETSKLVAIQQLLNDEYVSTTVTFSVILAYSIFRTLLPRIEELLEKEILNR